MAVAALTSPSEAGAAVTTPPTTQPSSGGIGVRLLQGPLSLARDPRAHEYIIDHLHAGTTIKRDIEVSNTTTSVQHVTVYAGGAQIVHDTFVPGRDNALVGWTHVRPGSIEMQPQSSQTVQITIAVPQTAPSRESYAVVWAQVSGAVNGINEVNRVGVRIYLDVGSGGNPQTTFVVGPLSVRRASNGHPVISATVQNRGVRAIDVNGSLTMRYRAGNLTAGPYGLARALTIPSGSSGGVSVTTPRLPPGQWRASLKVTADTVSQVQSGTVAIGPRLRMILPSSGGSSTPYVIGGVVALLVVILGAGTIVFRRRRSRAQQHSAKHARRTRPPVAT